MNWTDKCRIDSEVPSESRRRLTTIRTRGAVAQVHFITRHNMHSANFKDYEFPRATVTALWDGGLEDARRSIDSPEWKDATDLGNGIRIYNLTR